MMSARTLHLFKKAHPVLTTAHKYTCFYDENRGTADQTIGTGLPVRRACRADPQA
jgi:hypothetical protein